jgi:hypothetical protein
MLTTICLRYNDSIFSLRYNGFQEVADVYSDLFGALGLAGEIINDPSQQNLGQLICTTYFVASSIAQL